MFCFGCENNSVIDVRYELAKVSCSEPFKMVICHETFIENDVALVVCYYFINKDQLSLTNPCDALHRGECAANK